MSAFAKDINVPINDCISRQAAIDVICKACANGDDFTECRDRELKTSWCDNMVALRDLSSAQPEQQWIPCSERLPDTTDFVLTINIVSQCGVYRFDGDCWLDYDGLFVNEGIRAWMPLPEPI